jgi:phage gp29-like protein
MGIVPIGHVPIQGDKLVFRYGFQGEVGLRVNGVYTSSTTEVSDLGRVHWFTQQERDALVIHRYRPEDTDYLRPRKAGMVHGVGLRERLYWFWSIKNQVLGLLSDYLRWFAQGITIYYYEMGNEEAYKEVKRRAEENAGKPFLLFPREREGAPDWKPVERFDPSTASTNLMTELVTKYFDDVIRRMILGTGGTTVGGPTGLGSETSLVLERTAASVIKYDANALAETLTQDFVRVINDWTYPGYPTPRWVFELDSPNLDSILRAADFFINAGGRLGEESLRKQLGLPGPKKGENILGGLQAMQPAAVGQLPQGIPEVQANVGPSAAGGGSAQPPVALQGGA